jgi:hypothetical protein
VLTLSKRDNVSCDSGDLQVFTAAPNSTLRVRVESQAKQFICRGVVEIDSDDGIAPRTLLHSDLANHTVEEMFAPGVRGIVFRVSVQFPGKKTEKAQIQAELIPAGTPAEKYCREVAGKNNADLTSVIGAVL